MRVCVCVAVRVKHLNGCKTCTFMILVAGGCRECHSSAASEVSYDILWYRSGTLDRHTCFNFHVKFLWWAVANPRTTSPFFNKHFTEVSNSIFILAQLAQSETAVNFTSNLLSDIWNQPSLGLWQLTWGDGNPDNLFGIFLELEREGSAPNSNFFSDQDLYNGVCFARPIHSTSQFDKTSLSKCVIVMWHDVPHVYCPKCHANSKRSFCAKVSVCT
jgi:hypothetical protein